MPKPPRLHVPGGCYHVILRGNHREALFATDHDRHVLNEIVADVLSRVDHRFHAFCWMTNHLHALVQIGNQPLGASMQRIAMRYSRYRHKALDTSGHLFERRYKAKLVDVDAYFLTLVRYIHLNPVNGGIVTDPADYRWSSHRAYLGTQTNSWLTTEFGLSLFSADVGKARVAYAEFMGQVHDFTDENLDDEAHPDDSRILGTDKFVNSLPFTRYRPRSFLTLQELASAICFSHMVSVDLICSRSSARKLTPIRLQILKEAQYHRVATLTEVARFLNRDPSTLCQLLLKHQSKTQ